MTDILHITTFGIHPAVLVAAFFLDIAIGDPRWLLHPVQIMGGLTGRAEAVLRHYMRTPVQERAGGIILVAVTVVCTFGAVFLLQYAIAMVAAASATVTGAAMLALYIYLVSTTIAVRGLVTAARGVIRAVRINDLDGARERLSMIVGRDTRILTEKGVLRATTETLAENLSDGIIAPLFYLAIGGLPLAMTYKAINTLDSMVGYRDEKYRHFGWAAARLDDIANYIPARISGALIVVAAFVHACMGRTAGCLRPARLAWHVMLRDGGKHLSPNSGIPEAAMAGALGIRLGGPSIYGGVVVEKPCIGEEKGADYLAASEGAVKMVLTASFAGLALSVLITLMTGALR